MADSKVSRARNLLYLVVVLYNQVELNAPLAAKHKASVLAIESVWLDVARRSVNWL